MQKEPHGYVRRFLPQEFRQQHQVVVMDPDKVTRHHHLHHCVTEQPVHPEVLLPVLFLKLCVRREIVKQRPDRFVAESEVEGIHFLL